MYRILTDEDLKRVLDYPSAIDAIERTFRARAEGALVAPPRFSVETQTAGLVFTAGAETKYARAIGFRVYAALAGKSVDGPQLVAVFDNDSGELKGLVVGRSTGALRTAAINAVAIRHMARADARTLGILGSGFQAGYHARAAMAVRTFARVLVFSPNAAHREAFASGLGAEAGIPVEAAASAEAVVRAADVLICASASRSPVLAADWVRPGTHVNTIGPKLRGGAETPLELAQRSRVIATDSLEQVDGFPRPFFLAGTPERERLLELSEIVAGRQPGRLAPDDVTLFCSVGLSGTEVVVADEALRLSPA